MSQLVLYARGRFRIGEPKVTERARLMLELTVRDRAILEGIADGLDNSETACSLGTSGKTVRNHVTRVLDKIQVRHRYQAIVCARDAGLGMNGKATGSR